MTVFGLHVLDFGIVLVFVFIVLGLGWRALAPARVGAHAVVVIAVDRAVAVVVELVIAALVGVFAAHAHELAVGAAEVATVGEAVAVVVDAVRAQLVREFGKQQVSGLSQ